MERCRRRHHAFAGVCAFQPTLPEGTLSPFSPGLSPGLNGAKLGTEWLLSRRDRLIVARHEVPGIDVKRLRPGGTVEVIVSPSVSRIGSIVPLDGAIFLMIPGTSGLATIVLSLRDKTNRHRS